MACLWLSSVGCLPASLTSFSNTQLLSLPTAQIWFIMKDAKHRQAFIKARCIGLNIFWAISREDNAKKESADVNKEKGSQVRNKMSGVTSHQPACLCAVHPKEVAMASSSQSCSRFKLRCQKAGPHPPKEQCQLPACLLSIVIVTKGGHLWSLYNMNFNGLKEAEANTLWPWIKSV